MRETSRFSLVNFGEQITECNAAKPKQMWKTVDTQLQIILSPFEGWSLRETVHRAKWVTRVVSEAKL